MKSFLVKIADVLSPLRQWRCIIDLKLENVQDVSGRNEMRLGKFEHPFSTSIFPWKLPKYSPGPVMSWTGRSTVFLREHWETQSRMCYPLVAYKGTLRSWCCWFSLWTAVHETITWAVSHIIFSWFQAFAVFCMLYAFFWVITRRLEFICRRFGTLCLFHLHTQVDVSRMN